MLTLNVRNVNEGLSLALAQLDLYGSERPSRNGPVLAFPQPVATTYSHPTERVLFSPLRNANPAFHLLECLWMVSGRQDVAFPATLVKNMKNFSDDGKTFWGAYGHRWRNFFGWDQIDAAIQELKANPESRRVVVAMWNGYHDLDAMVPVDPDFIVGAGGGKDVPCNTHIYFDRRDGNLNMTVCCRSNDIIWGCYGANAVHMSFLQEYMAAAIGCPVGWYTQMSNDLHLYLERTDRNMMRRLVQDAGIHNFYSYDHFKPTPILQGEESILDLAGDIEQFFFAFDANKKIGDTLNEQYETAFFIDLIVPMCRAWGYRKTFDAAEDAASLIKPQDWRWAMTQWVHGQQAGIREAK